MAPFGTMADRSARAAERIKTVSLPSALHSTPEPLPTPDDPPPLPPTPDTPTGIPPPVEDPKSPNAPAPVREPPAAPPPAIAAR
jgi:hypothetical protein